MEKERSTFSNILWLVSGDVNSPLVTSEKSGGLEHQTEGVTDLRNFIETTKLFDCGIKGLQLYLVKQKNWKEVYPM